jgi:hypothetical protein
VRCNSRAAELIPDFLDRSAQDGRHDPGAGTVHTTEAAWRYAVPEKWQYKTVSIPPTQREQLDEILNSYGDAGWELVSVVVEGWRPLGFLGGAQQPTYRAIFKARA